jgi:6-phosphogluconolactonase (cycloisomerase 2 family)
MNQRNLILQLQAQLEAHLSTDPQGKITGIEESAQACAEVFQSTLGTLMQEIEQRIHIHKSKESEYKETAKHSLRLASQGKTVALQELRTDLSILYGIKLDKEV